jgi:TRAP-type C4-dicarboxylate transport system permease small subunit
LFFLKGSFEITKAAWVVPSTSLPKIKMGYIYLVLPVGALLMIFYLLLKLFTDIKKLNKQ